MTYRSTLDLGLYFLELLLALPVVAVIDFCEQGKKVEYAYKANWKWQQRPHTYSDALLWPEALMHTKADGRQFCDVPKEGGRVC